MEATILNPWTWQDQLGFVQARSPAAADRVLWCAGQTSVDFEGRPMHEGDMAAQLHQALDNVETLLREGGATLADVVKLTYYVTNVDAFFAAQEGFVPRLLGAGCRAAAKLVGGSRLAYPELLVEIEPIAVV